MMFHAVLAEGGYNAISRAADGRILELLPIVPGADQAGAGYAVHLSYELRDINGARRRRSSSAPR
jgi:hypothetical protein